VTHCFDKTLMETVTRDNVNPIEKVERTQLIMASAVHAEDDVSKLVRDNQLARVREFNGNLFYSELIVVLCVSRMSRKRSNELGAMTAPPHCSTRSD
jgi:hypothetical protein